MNFHYNVSTSLLHHKFNVIALFIWIVLIIVFLFLTMLYHVIGDVFFKRHAVFHTQRGGYKEPRVKTLRSPFSAEFWRN